MPGLEPLHMEIKLDSSMLGLITSLLQRIEALEASLSAAGIPLCEVAESDEEE